MNNVRSAWQGRFERNGNFASLDKKLRFDLAQSAARLRSLTDILGRIDADALGALPLGYSSSAGDPALREAIAARCGVGADTIVTTTGTALGLFLIAFELCRPGDHAVLVRPCFPPSLLTLRGCDVEVSEVHARFDEGYRNDAVQVAAALRPDTRLVSLATPMNPCGVTVGHETIRAILAAMDERAPRAMLFIDETFRETTYVAPVLTSFAALDRRIITGSSLSKAHGIPALRVGWLTVPDADVRERIIMAKNNIVLSGSPLCETIAAQLLANDVTLLAEQRDLMAANLEIISRWQEGEAQRINWVRPDAGAICCIRLDPTRYDAAAKARFWELLAHHEVQLAAGPWFGDEEGAYRLGFGPMDADTLAAALTQISKVLDALDAGG